MEVAKNKLYNTLNDAFTEAIKKIKDEEISLTDMYVSVKDDDLMFSIFDDAENVLFRSSLDEWAELKDDSEFEETVSESLKKVLNTDTMKKELESLDTVGPFSVVLVNEDYEPIEELITIDKDIVFLDDDFLKKMDKELDEFFEKLMSDTK